MVHPTIDEQLHGAQRLLDAVEADSQLSTASQESLTNVRRLLKQVTRSWAGVLPFHVQDNATLTELLAHTAPLAGPTLSAAIDGAVNATPAGSGLNIAVVSGRNAELRGLLARAIAELPRTTAGDIARTEIGNYLRDRVNADPS